MSLPFPSLKDLTMREVLLKELPREELPMKKELDALDRLPGNYAVEKSTGRGYQGWRRGPKSRRS